MLKSSEFLVKAGFDEQEKQGDSVFIEESKCVKCDFVCYTQAHLYKHEEVILVTMYPHGNT